MILEFLFETKIFFFRLFTVVFIVVMLLVLYRCLKAKYGKADGFSYAVFMTIVFYLMHEWTWQIGTALKWGFLNPIPRWIQHQSFNLFGIPLWVPNNLIYFTVFCLVLTSSRKVIRAYTKKVILYPTILLGVYQIIFNLFSPSVIYNDYGYATLYFTLGYQERITILIFEYFVPKILLTFSVVFLVKPRRIKQIESYGWGEYWQSNPFWRRLGARVLNHLQYLNLPDVNGMVLEVGCGFSKHKKYENHYVGVDIEKITKPMIIADVHHLPFQPKTFSLVYSFGLIEHLSSPHKALKEMKTISDVVYFGVPSRNGLIHRMHNLYHRLGWRWVFPRESYYSPSFFPDYERIHNILGSVDFYRFSSVESQKKWEAKK